MNSSKLFGYMHYAVVSPSENPEGEVYVFALAASKADADRCAAGYDETVTVVEIDMLRVDPEDYAPPTGG